MQSLVRARRPGKCPICKGAIAPGEELEVFLRKWVHAHCKKVELTRRIAQRDYVEVVPPDPDVVISDQLVGTRYYRRRNVRFRNIAKRL